MSDYKGHSTQDPFKDIASSIYRNAQSRKPALAMAMVCVLFLLGISSLGKVSEVESIQVNPIADDSILLTPDTSSDPDPVEKDPYADPEDVEKDFSPVVVPLSEFAEGTQDRTWGDGKTQFIYLVGVEGAGHHGVAPLLARMAQFADMAFYMRDRKVRKSIFARKQSSMKRGFEARAFKNTKIKHIFLEDNSFPSLHYKRHSKFSDIKKEHRYDLEWIVKSAEESGANVKLLLLTRPFLNQVWSHKNWDGGFRGHATTLARYMQYLNDEFGRIGRDDMWTRISYNWFSDELCPEVVPKLAEFLQWPSPRDPVKFCSKTPFHISTKVPVVEEKDKEWFQELQDSYKEKWGIFTDPNKFLIPHEH